MGKNNAGFPAGHLEQFLHSAIDKQRRKMMPPPPDSTEKQAVTGPELMELMRQQAANFGTRIITDDTKAEMKRVLEDIQSGKFTSEWMQECRSGQARFKATRRIHDAHQIEAVGETLRGPRRLDSVDRSLSAGRRE